MNEAAFQSLYTKWLKSYGEASGAHELKFTSGKSIPFAAVKEHQVASLLRAKHGQVVHKISDMALGFKPFDCFILKESTAFVVLMFYVLKQRRKCYAIDIDDFIAERERSDRKSITESKAREIGITIYL